jgi:hypothetical protein
MTNAERRLFDRGTISGQRLRRGLVQLLADDWATLAFFDELVLLDDGK